MQWYSVKSIYRKTIFQVDKKYRKKTADHEGSLLKTESSITGSGARPPRPQAGSTLELWAPCSNAPCLSFHCCKESGNPKD